MKGTFLKAPEESNIIDIHSIGEKKKKKIFIS